MIEVIRLAQLFPPMDRSAQSRYQSVLQKLLEYDCQIIV